MNPMDETSNQPTQNNEIKKNKSEIKQFMNCIENYYPFKLDHLRVERGQRVYVHSIIDDVCFISNGRQNGYVAKNVIFEPDVSSEPLIFIEPVAFEGDAAASSSYLTEMKSVSTSNSEETVPVVANVEFEETDHVKVIHCDQECYNDLPDNETVNGQPDNGQPDNNQPDNGQPDNNQPDSEHPLSESNQLESSFDELSLVRKPAKKITNAIKRAITQVAQESSAEAREDTSHGELQHEKVYRIPISQRANAKTSLIIVTECNSIFYRYFLSSVTKKGLVYMNCSDCRGKIQLKLDEKFITSFISGKKTRYGINKDETLVPENFRKMSTITTHSCEGRVEENLKVHEEKLMTISKRVINHLSHPERHCPEEIIEAALAEFQTLMSRKTVKEIFSKAGSNFKRNIYDKIHYHLEKRRAEKGVNSSQFNPAEYENSAFKLCKKAYEQDDLLLFVDYEELHLLRNAKSICLLDATFPKIKGYAQVLKCRIITEKANCLVFYSVMKSKTLDEYCKIFSYLAELLYEKFGENQIITNIFCTDEEFAFDRIYEMYVTAAKRSKCSFHIIDKWLRRMNQAGLKTFLYRKCMVSDDKDKKIVSENWRVLKVLVYLPESISLPMLEYVNHRAAKCSKITMEKFLSATKYIESDMELKSHEINWYNNIKKTKTYLDTTTSRLERSNASLKRFIATNSRNTNVADKIRLLNKWSVKESLKSNFFQNTTSRRTKLVIKRRKQMKKLGRELDRIPKKKMATQKQRKEIFNKILEVSRNF